MINIVVPPIDMINTYWHELLPFIERAADESHGEISPPNVLERLNKMELLLAVVYRDSKILAVVTFEQVNFDSGKRVLNIQMASGEEIDSWFEEIERIANDLAKYQNCSEVYIIGRAGWTRKMKHLGYKVGHTVLMKEVK